MRGGGGDKRKQPSICFGLDTSDLASIVIVLKSARRAAEETL